MTAPARGDIRDAIENLIFIYAERIDAGDFAGVGELFARARMLDPKGDLIGSGRDEIQKLFERQTKRYGDGSPMTQHVTSNVILDVDPDGLRVRARSRFSVMQALPDFPLQCIIAGQYEDEFAWESPEGWHFVERRMKPKLMGDLSRHLNYEIPKSSQEL